MRKRKHRNNSSPHPWWWLVVYRNNCSLHRWWWLVAYRNYYSHHPRRWLVAYRNNCSLHRWWWFVAYRNYCSLHPRWWLVAYRNNCSFHPWYWLVACVTHGYRGLIATKYNCVITTIDYSFRWFSWGQLPIWELVTMSQLNRYIIQHAIKRHQANVSWQYQILLSSMWH